MTGYPALVARELDIPMISGAPILDRLSSGAAVTLHAERGVVYEGDLIQHRQRESER